MFENAFFAARLKIENDVIGRQQLRYLAHKDAVNESGEQLKNKRKKKLDQRAWQAAPARRAGQTGLLGHGLADFLPTMMILKLLFVLLYLTIKLIHQDIDRSVKILVNRLDVNILP